jgi:hypothetical protein
LIDVEQADSKIVIEGLLTNQSGKQFVKVARTVGFYDEGINPAVSGATVRVTDNLGNVTPYTESENSGVYLPDAAFVGQVGRTYSLEVVVDGDTYSATEELLSVTKIDSLTYGISEEEYGDPEEKGRYYSAFMYTKEPQDEDNFYMFKFYRNGEWLNDNGEDITVTDDVAVGEAIEGLEMPEYHALGDSVSMEMYSLTKTQYIYWSDVANLIFSDGGVFSPLPANPRSNISGGALGVFQVSSVESDYVVIKE